MTSGHDHLEKFRQERERQNDRLLQTGHKGIQRFFALDHQAYGPNSALSPKVKELLGLAASLVLRCDDCITYHVLRCVEEEVSRDEALDVLNVALVVGGSITIPHVRRALDRLDEALAPGRQRRSVTQAQVPPSRSSADLAALLFAMLFPTLAAWLYFMVFTDRETLPTVYAISKVVQFSFPLAWTLAVSRGRLPRLNLTPRALLEGVGSGLVMVLALVLAYVAVMGQDPLLQEARPRILSRVQSIGAATPARFLALALFLSVIHSLLEEYYWRWFVFGRLQERVRLASAVLLSSAGFTLHHVIILHAFLGPKFWPATLGFSLAVALGGVIWAVVYGRCRLLAAPWISHILVDLAILAIGYDLIRELL